MIEDFYTTPSSLIEKMIAGLSLGKIKTILDIGAGKGDICDFITNSEYETADYFRGELFTYKEKFRRDSFDIDVIEINPDLQHILRGKEYRVIHDDFLTFRTYKQYNLIIGNFPFSIGDLFLERALQIIEENGGILRCLVNAETIRNPFSATRKRCVEKIRDLCGETEYLEGEFLHAERQTTVEVALIKIELEKETHDSLILDEMQKAAFVDVEDNEPAAVVEVDFYKQMVSSFNMECKAGVHLIQEYFALEPYIKNRIIKPGQTSDYSRPMLKLEVEGVNYSDGLPKKINCYLREVRNKYWEVLINHRSFTSKFTSNILETLHKKLNDLRDYDFTLFNIEALERELAAKISEGIDDAIMKIFEEFSAKYHWCEGSQNNIHYYNGWKTNQAHKIGEKVILPVNGISSHSYRGSHREIDKHYIQNRLADMLKVFQYLAQMETMDAYQLVGNQIHYADQRQDYNLDLRYFDVKFFKKGTCHIKFKNKILLDKLNIYGSRKKGWLPPFYGKVSYQEMDVEARAVVDEFQGRDEYQKVFDRPDFYIVEPQTTLQLTTSM